MRSKLLAVTTLCSMLTTASGLSHAQARVVLAKVAMTDSSAAALSTTKRVAIANVMVSFQASVGGEHSLVLLPRLRRAPTRRSVRQTGDVANSGWSDRVDDDHPERFAGADLTVLG